MIKNLDQILSKRQYLFTVIVKYLVDIQSVDLVIPIKKW